MDPIDLTTYKSPFEKIRLGKVFDGGYIIANIPNVYSLIISGGILDDISFENDFINKYNVKCVAFDGTIDALPGCNNDITFFKKNISNENNSTTTNLHDIIDSNTSLFLKMDIEGWEIPWIKSLTNDQMNKFEQMVIEFHNPFSKKEKDIFKKINKTHYLIHFHPNNCCGVVNHHGVIIPKYFECTYVHKKYFITIPEFNNDLIPSKLDMKNTLNNDIYINYKPFVHSSIIIFDWQYYLDTYPDLRKNGIHTEQQAMNHWLTFGRNEGRQCYKTN